MRSISYMEKLILFPINEIRYFNEGKKKYSCKNYQDAIAFFEKAMNIKYFKHECIKYLIDCHIELHHFDEVYKMIENEFVGKNLSEDYLLKKYLYTMILEEQYVEASELIKLYKSNQSTSVELKHYLDELMVFIEVQKEKSHDMMRYFLSDEFEDHIQIILNLDKIDADQYVIEINEFLNHPQYDPFIKFNLLKYLMEHELLNEVHYRNFYDESFIIQNKDFVDLLNADCYLLPINNVLHNIEGNYGFTNAYIRHIWLDFCIKHYPNLIEDEMLASAILHILLIKSVNDDYNIDAICKIYHVEPKRIFHYFKM